MTNWPQLSGRYAPSGQKRAKKWLFRTHWTL